METRNNSQLPEELISIANQLIETAFTEQHLHNLAQSYVRFKFHQSINFALLTELHYSVFREQQTLKEQRELQVVMELIILAADILDDIQDKDASIYPWSEVNFEENSNIIIGLLLTAFNKITLLDCCFEVRNFMSQQIHCLLLQSINGQQRDLNNRITTETEYLEMASLKSGSLTQLACVLGAGNVSEKTLNIIKTYSNYIGIIAQIRNDVHDLLTEHQISDLHIKKITLPVLYYLCIDDDDFLPIKHYYNSEQIFMHLTDSEKDHFMKVIRQGGAIQYCHAVEKIYYRKFINCIEGLPISNIAREQLLTLKF